MSLASSLCLEMPSKRRSDSWTAGADRGRAHRAPRKLRTPGSKGETAVSGVAQPAQRSQREEEIAKLRSGLPQEVRDKLSRRSLTQKVVERHATSWRDVAKPRGAGTATTSCASEDHVSCGSSADTPRRRRAGQDTADAPLGIISPADTARLAPGARPASRTPATHARTLGYYQGLAPGTVFAHPVPAQYYVLPAFVSADPLLASLCMPGPHTLGEGAAKSQVSSPAFAPAPRVSGSAPTTPRKKLPARSPPPQSQKWKQHMRQERASGRELSRLVIQRVEAQLWPSPEQRRRKTRALGAVEELIAECWKEEISSGKRIEAASIGSVRQGTDLPCSDVDVMVSYELSKRDEHRRFPLLKSWMLVLRKVAMEKLQQLKATIERANAQEVRPSMADVLRGREPKREASQSFTVKQLLDVAVPVLKLSWTDPEDGGTVLIDVTISEKQKQQLGFRDDKVRSVVAQGHQVVGQAVRLLKLWAKSNGVNTAFHGTPNSITWVTMFLSFLADSVHAPLLKRNHARNQDDPIGAVPLLLEFFRLLSTYNPNSAICATLQQLTLTPVAPPGAAPLWVVDPACPTTGNLAAAVTVDGLLKMQHEAIEALKTLHSLRGTPGVTTATRVFYPDAASDVE